MWDEWQSLLINLHFVGAKCTLPGGIQELLADYSRRKEVPYGHNLFKLHLMEFERFVRKYSHVLAELPHLVCVMTWLP